MSNRLMIIFGLAWLFLLFALACPAATITVTSGGSISAGIASAAAGDTVLVKAGTYTGTGVVVNKAITLQGEAGTVLKAATAGKGVGVTVAASGCTVAGLYIDSFQISISVANAGSMSGFKDNVRILGNHTYQSQFHCWIGGNNWLVEGNDFERVRWWDGQGDADYTRMFGTGHIFRGNYLHGTSFSSTDLAPASGSDYAHTDGIQYYGNNGEVLKNCTIEGNYFTDFHQGLFLCDEGSGSLSGLIIRNNVFWGQSYVPPTGSANFQGMPSWGICIGKNVGGTAMKVENNLMYNISAVFGIRAASTGTWTKNIVVNKANGTVYDPSTSNPASVTISNMLHGHGWAGQGGFAGVDVLANPALANVGAPLGADGIPWTADDGWRPTAAGALLYGPQSVAAPAPIPTPTPPPVYATKAELDALAARVAALEARKNWSAADIKALISATRLVP